MDGEANLPAPPAPSSTKNNFFRPTNPDSNLTRSFTSTSSSSSSSFSSSSPGFIRDVRAAFKRHRPLGTMQSNNIRPRRILVPPQQETSKNLASNVVSKMETEKPQNENSLSHRVRDSIALAKGMVPFVRETQEDALICPPSISGTIANTYEESSKPFDVDIDQSRPSTDCKNNDTVSSSLVESQRLPLVDSQKKVQFALGNNARPQETERDVSNQVETSTAISHHDLKHQNFQSMEVDFSLRSDGGISSLLEKRTMGVQDQLHEFRNFLQSDPNYNMTQSSVVGSSCATTTLINSASVPLPNSMTYCSRPVQNSGSHVAVESLGDCDVNFQPRTQGDMVVGSSCATTMLLNSSSVPLPNSMTYCSRPVQNSGSHVAVESLGDCNLKFQPMTQGDIVQPSYLSPKYTSGTLADQTAIAPQPTNSAVETQLEVKDFKLCDEQQSSVPKESAIPKDTSCPDDKSTKVGDDTDIQHQALSSNKPSLDVKSESCRSGKQEKSVSGKAAPAPRKRNYDPDLFFKVNGKLYQRLGKIGSGGSSEVHKVISSDCKIYALKKIKLKGRDYATAYGFCQEIMYLNKLKGKNNIIQLIDYEVTDKTLLQEVLNGSMNNKDGRVKEDGYIYMVLEYGEIDLAHMLSQKWKEMDDSSLTIDENWLRFYWQQILQAVNTIHEERIVHSDLKPANFLLVRGSLKLIDFGIAKAIMSDTTNIQRDSQVGTLSYMSPEAFMCNETDVNGKTIKCGRPSDIWSLGCILYQMVYGRTPFSEYKTFWAKFKVITDPNHEITYEPVSNPWLLDLMKKCLAWDRKERWRIPELLQHPFLVPPVPPPQASPQDQSCKLLQLITESCTNDQKAMMFCSQLQQLLRGPRPAITSQVTLSRDQQCKLLSEMSNLCFQLQEHLANSKRD
ncbi:serine/threonine-protein kinase MPS1 isoform X2 [Cornus florida]|uniref:serine/threonine-protein kinase MPS1 isoform X2 n=1 Tax=Cornus florida TaxID=4283 RepID=UPI002897DA7F|nr:serine/threonine-protein kinase MPS1 isoform X2 [Cornus florida]